MQVDQVRDFIERVGWTFLQVSAGAILDLLISGQVTWKAIGYAVAIAACKVIVAQQFGDRSSGDAIPGGVLKT